MAWREERYLVSLRDLVAPLARNIIKELSLGMLLSKGEEFRDGPPALVLKLLFSTRGIQGNGGEGVDVEAWG